MKYNNQDNILYKKLGLGLLNTVIAPQPAEISVEDTAIDISNSIPEDFKSVVDINTIVQFATGEANINQDTFIPSSGFKIPTEDGSLPSGIDLYIKASGENQGAINDVRISLIPSPEVNNSSIGIFKCDASGDNSFIFSAGGANIDAVNQIGENPNIEISVIESGSKILYKNKNSNKNPGVFEMLVLSEDDVFNPSNFTAEELLEIGRELGISSDILESWVSQTSSSSSGCFDSI